ncbi:hypothetical protein HMPREF3192_00448 [Atopobium deltae]|uniref:Uncharacterized protein n=1 Tax=Atopobium deltae TaxID=1393034 RepID=A0A133XVZ6_9ACTN|nr:hypothetical protein HMPREF3192_00448 [Atopobium deltae]
MLKHPIATPRRIQKRWHTDIVDIVFRISAKVVNSQSPSKKVLSY